MMQQLKVTIKTIKFNIIFDVIWKQVKTLPELPLLRRNLNLGMSKKTVRVGRKNCSISKTILDLILFPNTKHCKNQHPFLEVSGRLKLDTNEATLTQSFTVKSDIYT